LQAEPLLSLAAAIAGEHRTKEVLEGIVHGLAGQPGVALARIWLRLPGDRCSDCYLRSECPDQTQCLHLVASAGTPCDPAAEDWTSLQGHFRRIPLNRRKIGTIGATGESVLVHDSAPESESVGAPDWAEREKIRGFVGHPLVFRGKILGVLALFTRDPVSEQEFFWLRMFADQAAVAIANARAFELREQAENKLRISETKYRSLIDLSPIAIFILDRKAEIISANPSALELLRGSAEEIIGMPISTTYTPTELAQFKIPVEQIESGIFRFERTFVRRDQSVISVEVLLSPFQPDGRQAVIRDISERKREAANLKSALEEATKSHQQLQLILDHIPAMVWHSNKELGVDLYNRRWLDYTGRKLEEMQGPGWRESVHPEDLPSLLQEWGACWDAGKPFEYESRLRAADGGYRWFLDRSVPVRDAAGSVVSWYGAATDVDASKQAEREIRQHEEMLHQVIDISPLHMFIWEADATASYGNRASREYFGAIPPMNPFEFIELVTHPEDVDRLREEIRNAMSRGEALEVEARMRRHDGAYHWFLYKLYPLRDKSDRIIRWCGARIDIDAQKQSENRAQRENLALREEIDKVSMFEEIVGTSPALQALLARVTKVAPTDSTVFITGETGTGKELIARAIHKRSPRSAQAFVSVNCAAIPRDLIASELFGHEKGAFTGALQRRLGRFEVAEGGTIFLDEIGELPADTQIALLRVLQEKEFDRVGGGGRPIRANVRVITATHRDLPGAIAAGTFRSDLFYRINVFPLEVPPLRERKKDIRLLVEYFIDRYASKVGKTIKHIDRKTLERLQSYTWPGNIRELQNVIERSVILCETEEFSIDESWLSERPGSTRPLPEEIGAQEKALIEAALAKTGGRVSGPSGAAIELGMPASTLDSKIKSLKIDKHRFRA
jgi:formate hydrogenlyase transcriptional activator